MLTHRGLCVLPQADGFLIGCVPLVGMYLSALGHGDSSACCMLFLQSYLNRLRRLTIKDVAAAQPHMEHARPLIPALVHKMMYPLDFCFDKPGEEEEEFVSRRKAICVLFRTLAAIDETACLQVNTNRAI